MRKFKAFVEAEEKKTKMVTVDYKIFVEDVKGDPSTLITDFDIVKSENSKVEIRAKGYTRLFLTGYGWASGGSKKKGWVAFDDAKDNKTRVIWKKCFVNGSKRIKVYEI